MFVFIRTTEDESGNGLLKAVCTAWTMMGIHYMLRSKPCKEAETRGVLAKDIIDILDNAFQIRNK